MSAVEITVIDPGDAVDRSQPNLPYVRVCFEPDGFHHEWQCVTMSYAWSTWICAKCRRVEKRAMA